MGLDVSMFKELLERFLARWNFSTIDRNDVNPTGEPQIGCRSLDAAGTLGLVLHWLCLTMSAYTLQQPFGITLAVCLRYLASGMQHLLAAPQDHPQARFLWPTTKQRVPHYSASIKKKFPLLTKCFGFLDGLNFPVLLSDDEDVQNAYYNGWTCSHYCSYILAFAPDGTIRYAILNALGSWQDLTIAEPLYDLLNQRWATTLRYATGQYPPPLLEWTPPGYWIIRNTAFLRKSERLQSQILAPVKLGDCLPTNSLDFT
ncbi:hypothetical protein PTTG_02708 [Puccinia triticina 1-1 BBBD Race 1]|uniref:DDE Tnp4 domain-containing protein n=1 Tax=Puccinia triticina (isolate 1-1 / race 1 (BBBD)) TaxID=630390 RepID=A0A180GJT4_PUCT1|nr:hypothetical protein PTTG_02708 [Puccinia triticina 1-1 BBBD Race 1]